MPKAARQGQTRRRAQRTDPLARRKSKAPAVVASALLQLPAEIIEMILRQCSDAEQGQMALVCRQLRDAQTPERRWRIFVGRTLYLAGLAALKGAEEVAAIRGLGLGHIQQTLSAIHDPRKRVLRCNSIFGLIDYCADREVYLYLGPADRETGYIHVRWMRGYGVIVSEDARNALVWHSPHTIFTPESSKHGSNNSHLVGLGTEEICLLHHMASSVKETMLYGLSVYAHTPRPANWHAIVEQAYAEKRAMRPSH